MAARICMQLFCMKLCFITQKQRQIDEFQEVTGQILKVINLALFLVDEAKFHAQNFACRCALP